MQKFQCLLFVLKRSYIYYYIIYIFQLKYFVFCSFVLCWMVFGNRFLFEYFFPSIRLLFKVIYKYLQSCWFHCVDMFYIKFRFCETFTVIIEVRNSRVTKSSYETELRKMTSHFELLTQKFYRNSTFELLTRIHKILN